MFILPQSCSILFTLLPDCAPHWLKAGWSSLRFSTPSLRTAGWKIGDVILKVGDVDIREYAEANVAPSVSSSTPQDREVRRFNYSLLSGGVRDTLVLTVEDGMGKRQVRTLKRLPTEVVGPMFKTVGSEFRVLPGNVAYVAVNEFEDDGGVKTILDHVSQIQSARGLAVESQQVVPLEA